MDLNVKYIIGIYDSDILHNENIHKFKKFIKESNIDIKKFQNEKENDIINQTNSTNHPLNGKKIVLPFSTLCYSIILIFYILIHQEREYINIFLQFLMSPFSNIFKVCLL